MIIESLIRVGSPFLGEGGPTHQDVIKHITDVVSPNTRNFFQNICLAEVDAASNGDSPRVLVHPLSMWGDWVSDDPTKEGSPKARASKRRPKEMFKQDSSRAVGIPFAQPSGGNPLVRQGCYPVPVYIVYEASLRAMSGNEEEVFKFLQSRALYTIGWEVTEEELRILANGFSSVLPKPTKSSTKTMAVIVVVDYRTGLYAHKKGRVSEPDRYAALGESRLYPGETIVSDLANIVENLWAARLKEAGEKGSLNNGTCSFCKETGYTVSSYAKSWPLFSTTYSYPLPQELKEFELVKSVGLCPQCYRALVFGANLLRKTERTLDRTVTKELFSPTQSVQGKADARKSKKTKDVFGLCYALPVLDGFLRDPETASDFIAASLWRLDDKTGVRDVDLSLKDLLGFEAILSDAIANESYRLTVMYYMGDWSRGAVDLIANIQDVVPSVARGVSSICTQTGDTASRIARMITETWNWTPSENQQTMYRRRHSSLPYNLILAYGRSYVWQSLDSVLHKRPLAVKPFLRNVAQRLQDQAKDVSVTGDFTSNLGFCDEIVFLLTFSEFLLACHDSKVSRYVSSGLSNSLKTER
jgi:hypothetical protein